MSYIGSKPANKVVKTADIEDNAVTSAKIDTDTIAAGDLAANSVDSSELVDGSIDTSHLADNQVTLAKMAGLARGKLIYGDASGDPAALAVGSANEVLTHDGTDFDWAAAGGGGKVLQVVQGAFRNAETSTTSSTVVNGGCTVAITPSATSSKILVMFTASVHDGTETTAGFYDISRAIDGGATTAGIIGAAAGAPTTQGLGGHSAHYGTLSTQYVDSPSTTSEVTYQLMIGRWFGSGNVAIHNNATNSWSIAIEIDGS